ncbi:MAG: DNA polymerase IV [Muribaculaceae bacterium]|nr:DNA polymerase IV [Muribaculaceae bacterium]
MTRKIIHIDMDAFFASVEQRDDPSLRGVPVAVGNADGRGVVAAASYEARRYGVRSAMSSAKAKKLCPGLRFVDCRFDVYKAVSSQIHDIFHEYTDLIEPISLDEAFLDVTENFRGISLAVDIAREIKAKIRSRLSLVASAGVSYNKFLAKIASDYRKPDGLYVIPPQRALDFISAIPVESFWGVGPVTAAKMHNLGIYTGEDLRRRTLGELRLYFGKAGPQYYQFARGIDNRPVEPVRIRKSVGVEHTLDADISTSEETDMLISQLVAKLLSRLARAHFTGSSLTLKVRFADFSQLTRSISTLPAEIDGDVLLAGARELIDKAALAGRPIRLMGLSVSRTVNNEERFGHSRQLVFDFGDYE